MHLIDRSVWNKYAYLSLPECSDGQYGYNCVENCSMTCINSVKCDKITGHCVGGCRAGWTGDMCEKGKALVQKDTCTCSR